MCEAPASERSGAVGWGEAADEAGSRGLSPTKCCKLGRYLREPSPNKKRASVCVLFVLNCPQ